VTEMRDLAIDASLDSQKWFPRTTGNLFFTAACIAGEAGELVNKLKKVERGSHALSEVLPEAIEEATDVLTYLLNFYGALGIDPEVEYHKKRAKNEARFGRHSKLPARMPQFVLDEAAGRESKPQTWQTPGEFAS
jgi:NTP pyrophosphatase (non-canonical NTP hydrolase)